MDKIKFNYKKQVKGVTHSEPESNNQLKRKNLRSMSDDLGVKNRPFNKQKEEPQRLKSVE